MLTKQQKHIRLELLERVKRKYGPEKVHEFIHSTEGLKLLNKTVMLIDEKRKRI